MSQAKFLSMLFAFSLAVTVLPGTPMLAQSAESGYLKVQTNTGRAGIFLDGKFLGPAANYSKTRTYAVTPGEHELVLREPRYEEFKTTVRIEPGKTTTVSQSLQPRPLTRPPFGKLRLLGFDKYAALYINGQFMGHADEFNAFWQGLLLNPGDYEARIVSPAGATLLEQKVTIREGQTAKLRAQ